MSRFVADEALRRIRALATAAAPPDPDPRFVPVTARASISRILLRAAEMYRQDGADAEALKEWSRRAGRPHDEMRLQIATDYFAPFVRQTRADTVLPGSAGGYLTATEVPGAADAVRPTRLLGPMGVTFVDATNNISIARQTGIATATWQGSETTAITESQQTLSNLALTPKTVSVYSEVSRQLLLQTNLADRVVARDCFLAIANAADIAALTGTGQAGQPAGLIYDQNILTFSGASATVGTFTSAFVALGDALDDDSGGVIANRAVAGLLRQRPETTGSTKTIWDGTLTDGAVVDYPARSSTAMPSGSCIAGNWKYLVIATWGAGIELVVNPYGDQVTGTTNFQKGIVGYRTMLSMDAGTVYPGAFNFAASVT